MNLVQILAVFMAAMTAGAINSVAGGGTVFNFSALVWIGLPVVRANATNATSLIPGSLGGAVALWRELKPQWRDLMILLVPTVIGSLLGAFVVVNSPESIFRRVVPFLVLFATAVFASRNRIVKWAQRRAGLAPDAVAESTVTPIGYAFGMTVQLLISIYGGYFGAGIGILMLTSLSMMGMTDLHKMNALKNMLAVAINATAAAFFILRGSVVWPVALLAAAGAMIGGYGLARYARRIDQNVMRWGVVTAGIVVSIWMLVRLYQA